MHKPEFRFILLVAVTLFGIGTQSCVSYRSQLVVQDEKEKKMKEVESAEVVREIPLGAFQEPRIRPLDLLMIKINTFEGKTEEFLTREFSPAQSFINFDPSTVYFNSYLVSEDGMLQLPLLDSLEVAGLTTSELKKKIDEAYKPYIQQVSTSIKLANLRVTVFGEVEKPGLVYLYNEKNTILDAISLAGDFTDFSNRKKVKLIRQVGTTGKTKSVVLNLQKPDFINTEYYYVRPDDVIYIEPQKAKSFDISARSFGIVLSTVSVLAVITGIVIN